MVAAKTPATATRSTRSRRRTSSAAEDGDLAPTATPAKSVRRRSVKVGKKQVEDEGVTPGLVTPKPFRPSIGLFNQGGARTETRAKSVARGAADPQQSFMARMSEPIVSRVSPAVSRIVSTGTETVTNTKFVGSILVAAAISVLVSLLINASAQKLTSSSSSPVSDEYAELQKQFSKLETNLGGIQEKFSSLASSSDLQLLQEQHRQLKKRQELQEGVYQKEIEQLRNKRVFTDIIKTEVARALADRVEPADYASYYADGRVVGHSSLYPRRGDPWFLPSREGDWYLFSLPYDNLVPSFISNLASKVFPVHPKASIWLLSTPSPGYEVPGHCLPLNGSEGYVEVKLRSPVLLNSVALEHIPIQSAYDISTAPKDMELFGMSEEGEWAAFSQFSYDIRGKPMQVFPIKTDMETSRLKLQVLDNHGSPDYTCLYRLKAYAN